MSGFWTIEAVKAVKILTEKPIATLNHNYNRMDEYNSYLTGTHVYTNTSAKIYAGL